MPFNPLHLVYCRAMGIDVWMQKTTSKPTSIPAAVENPMHSATSPPSPSPQQETLTPVSAKVTKSTQKRSVLHPHYLQAMGITRWQQRVSAYLPAFIDETYASPEHLQLTETAAVYEKTDTGSLPSLPKIKKVPATLYPYYLQTMGITVWQPRVFEYLPASLDETQRTSDNFKISTNTETIDSTMNAETITNAPVELLDWQSLQQRVAQCTACELHKTRTQTVFGVGDPKADLMLVGEAPGADEDVQGEPFVGRAGQLLNNMLLAINLNRENIYIANILKCRPPDNRDPTVNERLCCTPFLKQQIMLIQPKIIVALGKIASSFLLDEDKAMGELRDKSRKQTLTYSDTGIRIIATYHPAYLLRSPKQKAKSWEDLQLIKNIIDVN